MEKKKKILMLIGITLIIITFIFTNNNKNKENKEITQYESTTKPQKQVKIKDKEKTFTKKDDTNTENKEENKNEENEKKSFNKKKKEEKKEDDSENKAVEINADEINAIFGKEEKENEEEAKEVIREEINQNSNNNKVVLEVKSNKKGYKNNENKGYIDENEAQKKANAQLDKDSNNGNAVNGVEPYDLNQPNEDIIMTVDNSFKDPDDIYDLMFPNVNQIYNNSINYDYPYGPIEVKEESESLYDINYMEDKGAVIWNGYKFTTYPEHVLPGTALKIPGRHLEDGFVTDAYGFICIASDYYPKGTVLQSPFGRPMRVYDVFAHDQPEYRLDVYVR